jgi:sterol desaturase/sphingolipid hydroxylase (fatty acid hydroxylase superfamily)
VNALLEKFLPITLVAFPLALIAFEKLHSSDSLLTKRDVSIFMLLGIGQFFTWLLKAFAVLLLVNFLALFEIFSLSNLPVPRYLSIIISFLFIDFSGYFTHWLFHKISVLWKLHKLHHSDRAVDTITTFFHHPLEGIANFLLNTLIFVLFDVPVPVILLYGVVASIHAPLTHFKILLPEKWNKIVSFLIVTPNFHRIHHSLDMKEGNSNFGIVFPFWDKLFGTCVSKTYTQMKTIKFGINLSETPDTSSLKEYLINPFIRRHEKS